MSMTKCEAKMKGYGWTEFKDIPLVFRNIYALLLATDQLAYHTVMGTVTGINMHDQCCEYWFNNQIIDTLEEIRNTKEDRDE